MIELMQVYEQPLANRDPYITVNGKINDQFREYLNEKYGPELWLVLLHNKKFNDLVNIHAQTFGDTIFQALVNHTSEVIQIGVDFILSDFSSYIFNFK